MLDATAYRPKDVPNPDGVTDAKSNSKDTDKEAIQIPDKD